MKYFTAKLDNYMFINPKMVIINPEVLEEIDESILFYKNMIVVGVGDDNTIEYIKRVDDMNLDDVRNIFPSYNNINFGDREILSSPTLCSILARFGNEATIKSHIIRHTLSETRCLIRNLIIHRRLDILEWIAKSKLNISHILNQFDSLDMDITKMFRYHELN